VRWDSYLVSVVEGSGSLKWVILRLNRHLTGVIRQRAKVRRDIGSVRSLIARLVTLEKSHNQTPRRDLLINYKLLK